MTESKVSSSSGFSSRAKNASAADHEATAQNGHVGGDIRSFEFDECSGNFGVVLENKDPCSPSRARTALGNIRITELLPGSRAKQDGLLEVGDRVLEINGRDLSKASLERARWYLGSAVRSGKLKIKVRRGSTESNITPLKNGGVPATVEFSPDEASRQKNRVKKIHILKDSRGLGVQISMKLNHDTGEKGVFISDVSPGGAAARDGRLKEGDELLWINGHSLIGVTQQEAIDLLRASPRLIQLVISVQGSESSLERKVSGTPSKRHSLKNVSRRAAIQDTRNLPRAPSTENLSHKGRKMSSDHMKTKNDINQKQFEKATTKSNGPALQQSMENGPAKKADHNSEKENQIEEADLLDKSHSEENHLVLNENVSVLSNGRSHSFSSSSESSNGPLKSSTEDVLLSKGEESLESEPVTLEDKPLSKGSTVKASQKLPSPPVIDASKKRNSPNIVLNTPRSKDKPTNDGTRLEPGQISPSLPRPQSPGGMGIAFSARYLGDPPSNVMTIAMPTPRNIVGNNERDSPQAKRKWSNESLERRSSKAMEEEIVTIVLVKGMSGKGLGFTIVGGKGSPHGDMAVYIKNILQGGAAEADGRMKRGDEVLSVNGTSFEGFTHQEALDTFKNLRRGIVTLKVRRNSPGAPSVSTFTTPKSSPGSSRRNSKDVTAESSSSSNSSSPTMFRKLRQKRSQKEKITEIVLYKEPGNSLGIGLGERHPSTQIPGIFVQCVIQGTPAAHDGRLRQGDQLLEINDMKLEGQSVENIYSILDKVPPGKVYIKVVQNNKSDKLPLRLNDELTKLQTERQVLDKKMCGKSKSVGTASTLSGASESSESCDNLTSLSSSCDLLIPLSTQPNVKKKKLQTTQESDDDVFTNELDSAEYLEDIYTIIKQPTGELGMGVTIEKSRGNTIVEGVSVKSVIDGGSAALATSPRGVGLKLGDQIIEVDGTHLRGMDQEDVIKIFRDLPSSTQMKIRRSKMAPQQLDGSTKALTKRKESVEKTAATQDPVSLPKPPEGRRRSSQRGKVKPVTQDEKTSSSESTDGMALSEHVKAKKDSDSPVEYNALKKLYHNGIKAVEKSQDQERLSNATDDGQQRTTSQSTKQVKAASKDMETSKDLKNKTSYNVKDELGDNLFIPSGYRKMTVNINKGANSTLGLSLVPSYGNLKGYFQIRRLQSGMVCAQDGQLHIGDKLVSVNGVSLKGVTHSMALQLLKKPTKLVTFVILREGVESNKRVSSPASQSKANLSSGQNSAVTQTKGIDSEPSISLTAELAEKLPSAEKPVPRIKSQQTIESENVNERSGPQSTSSEDGNAKEDVLKVPCTPPPSPLLGVEHLLDSDLSVLPPSFCPPPPPDLAAFPPLGADDDLSLSAFPVVSPPPDLSPRMKEFLEKDPFKTADHQENDGIKFTHDDEILPEFRSALNQASSPGSEAVADWDLQSLLDACNDLNTYGNDEVLTSERNRTTEAPSATGNSKPNEFSISPSETKSTKENKLQKRLETSSGSSAVENRNDFPSEHSGSPFSKPGFGRRVGGLGSMVKEHDTKGLTTPPTISEQNVDDDVKPVAGRRVENVPFVITYQKKFRSLGVKVDQTEEGDVVVSDVSSFGLVGKDGNIRVGDVLLSINETFVKGMAVADVQNMIKNCPRGDVRIVAQAGSKLPQATEVDLKERGQRDEIPDKVSQAGKEAVPDVLSNVAFQKPWVDMPSELTSQTNTDASSKTVPNLYSSSEEPDTRGKVSSTILPQQHTDDLGDDFTITEGFGDSGLEGTDFGDLPPSIPPPPIPANDLQVEDYSGDVDEPLVQDIVEDVSFNPPTNFEDFLDDKIESALSYDSEEVEASTTLPQPLHLVGRAAPHGSSTVQKKTESGRRADFPSGSGQERKMPADGTQTQIPIKPPSLFGDDTESESIPSEAPRKLAKNSFVEDASARESSQWNGLDHSPIKPPSLFDDELESLPSLPSAPPPPKLSKEFISLDTLSSASSSPFQSPRFDRETSSYSPNTPRSYFGSESGSSTPSRGRSSTLGIPDPFSDVPIQPPDVVDDDMSSLPPAPPPPRSSVNGSSSLSVRSGTSIPLQHEDMKVPHITSPLPQPTKPERKNSKKRILPLRIRSKKGRKTSEQSDSSYVADGLYESPPQGVVAPIISSDVNQLTSLTHVEPPEDDMESLPPAPPPPRMSPLTVESLESIADGLQPVKIKPASSRPAFEERRVIAPTGAEFLHSSQQSPKKKKKSFRRNVIQMEAEGFSPESRGSSSNIPVPPETDRAEDNLLKHFAPPEDEVAVTDSSDAMSPPPLPPEMELWSEAGAAEAELALLDQILTLEDSLRSGNEQSGDGGSPSSTKPPSLFTEVSYMDTKSTESKEGSEDNKSQEARYHTDAIMSKEGSSGTNIAILSLEELSDIDSRGVPELEPVNFNSSVDAIGAKEGPEAYCPVVDFQERTKSDTVRQKPSGGPLKQLSEGEDPARNLTKHKRPAPPIPEKPSANSKATTVPRKSLPGGIPVLPSRPDIRPKAALPSHEPSPKYHREQQRLSSPVKEKTSRKLFSKSHKGKDKRADSSHLASPDTSFDSHAEGRERSRSWTKKLFGFRSRSRSKNRDKSKDLANRSRSVSPPRGLFSRSRRSSPPLPPPTTKKDALSKHKKGIEGKYQVTGDMEKYNPIEEIPVLSKTLPSAFKLSDPSQPRGHVEGINNFGSPTTSDDNSSPEPEENVFKFQSRTGVGTTVPNESYRDKTQVENVDLNHGEKESDNEIQGTSLLTEVDDDTKPDAYFRVDTTNRLLPPPPPHREKHSDATALIIAGDEEQPAVEDTSPMKYPSKPPVSKRPAFLESVSTLSRQQQETMEELKNKINKASSFEDRLGTAPDMIEDPICYSEGDDIEVSEDLPSPGPPTFKPIPPPLALGSSSSPVEEDKSSKTARCPNSPGPPRFKPPPPPLTLKGIAVQNGVTSDETLDSPVSPGPPKFIPAPPPVDLRVRNKNIDSEERDLPSTADVPNIKPLPPVPVTDKMQSPGKSFSVERIAMEGTVVESDAAPALQNDKPPKTKPLPPIPTNFSLNSKDNSHKLPLSRPNAQECDNKEDVDNREMSERTPEPPLSQVTPSEDNNNAPVSQVAEPEIMQDAAHEVNASILDELDSSELSSEWDDTCSSTQAQDDAGQPMAGNKFAKSASFSAGDVHIQRPSIVDERTKRLTPATMRPPPFMRRRSSSLPQLFPDAFTGEASEGRAGQVDYWHTGNLQQLINSRNQEPDVDEGIIEVQLLKEQQSIGLMVVGGLDTHLGMLYIKSIQPNSPAANCNRLRVGDQLLQVNDNCLVGVTHGEALNILKNTPPLVKLTVARKKDGESDGLELVAEGRRVADAEEPIVSAARESSTISKTSLELSVSPPPDRGQRPKSLVSLSSFGSSFNNDAYSVSPSGSFDDSDDYVPAYLEPESPTLTLCQDDVPVTIIDGIPGENDSTTTEEEEEVKPFSKTVSWAVSDDDTKVFTVEILKNGRAGLGLSVSGGVDTAHDDIMVRQILSNSVTAHNGHVKKGDILLSVNGKSFKGLTNAEALRLLKDTPERVTLVVSRPLGHKQHSKGMTLLRTKNTNKDIISDSDAWPTREELAKKKNLANTNSNAPPALEKIPLDVAKQNGEHSTFDRLKKRFFSNGGPMNLKERLHKVPQGPCVTEITLEKGASGLGFSLGGGQDSLYGDAPIHVRYVFKDSVTGRSGALKPGDEILEVNGQKVAYMTNVDVLELIRRLPYGPVIMKIRRK